MSGLRRLRDSFRRAVGVSGTRNQARKLRRDFRNRLLQPLSVLHEHLRLPHDSRTRARGCDRLESSAPRPGSLGCDRRRRRALDRRQSHHSHAAPQRRPESAALQQSHLRFDQGPVFADIRSKQENEIDAVRFARPPVQSDVARDRRRSHIRRALRRCVSRAI